MGQCFVIGCSTVANEGDIFGWMYAVFDCVYALFLCVYAGFNCMYVVESSESESESTLVLFGEDKRLEGSEGNKDRSWPSVWFVGEFGGEGCGLAEGDLKV